MEKEYTDPIDYLMAVMNDEGQTPEIRLEAASVLMPYFHAPLLPIEQEDDDE